MHYCHSNCHLFNLPPPKDPSQIAVPAFTTPSVNILRLSLVQEGCDFEGTPPQWGHGSQPDIEEIKYTMLCLNIH